MQKDLEINIRPKVSILYTLRHLPYDETYAIAEFIDNAIDSYYKYEKELKEIEGENFKLKINIDISRTNKKITIKDNAAGINKIEYERAFVAAMLPSDRTGLSEFGMGMKSAACWLSNNWQVRTKAVGEEIERTIIFNIAEIVEKNIENLPYFEEEVVIDKHYTIVQISNTDKQFFNDKDIKQLKQDLTSIYRHFIRNEIIELTFGDDLPEKFKNFEILNAPFIDDLKQNTESETILWKRDIGFNFGNGSNAKGFVCLLETGISSVAGFVLFRRGRVILGTDKNKFAPELIFGKPGSKTAQRLYGEIHLDGINVTHTKDNFQWDNKMENFLQFIRTELTKSPSFYKQVNVSYLDIKKGNFKVEPNIENNSIIQNTQNSIPETPSLFGNDNKTLNTNIPNTKIALKQSQKQNEKKEESKPDLVQNPKISEFSIELQTGKWNVFMERSDDFTMNEIVDFADYLIHDKPKSNNKLIGLKLAMKHRFIQKYCTDDSKIEIMEKIAASLIVAELTAKESGSDSMYEIRRNVNQVLNRM